jgi:hypothetical protein
MFAFIEKLITNPLYGILAVLVLWVVSYLLLSKLLKISNLAWIRLEYAWIAVGFIAVLVLIDENRKRTEQKEVDKLQFNIENTYHYLFNELDIESTCQKFNNSLNLSPHEFDSIQRRSDIVCQWAKDVRKIILNDFSTHKTKIEKLPLLEVDDFKNESIYSYTIVEIESLNDWLSQLEKLKKDIKDDSWNQFKYSVGILFLIIAFAIRLTINSHKVKMEKEKLKNG